VASKTVPLSDKPGAGDDFEDYIAGLFQASGYYVEKQLTETDGTDILELDIVATNYTSTASKRNLIEVKGGKWGYTDLFKVVGWMRYLDFSNGSFFHQLWDGRENAESRMAPLGLDVVGIGDHKKSAQLFADRGYGKVASDEVWALWRHSNHADRSLIGHLVARAKAGSPGARVAKTYYRQLNDGTFYARTPDESLRMLYAAFADHPRLALGYALELDGGAFDPQTGPAPSASFKGALYHGEHFDLQACMYIEHRARVAILKAAVDYAETYQPPKPGQIDWVTLMLPSTFVSAFHWLRAQPNYRLYATFWQQFLWGWGGFFLDHMKESEFEWMSTYSGIPVDEIPNALSAYDHFFPIQSGWLVTPGNYTNAVRVMNFPMAFHGIGAHHRRQQYGFETFSALPTGRLHTTTDLGKWVNNSVDLMTP
jgi:hypothetical protein